MVHIKAVLELLDAPIELELGREDDSLTLAVLTTTDERRVLFIARTYRLGVGFIIDRPRIEVREAREGDPWKLWSSDCALGPDGTV